MALRLWREVDAQRRDDARQSRALEPVRVELREVQDVWLLLLQFAPTLGLGRLLYYLVFKRLLDVVVASMLLLLLAPVLLILTVAIRLDSPGPALFRQRRVGQGGKAFTVYKFRSMVVQAPLTLESFRGADGSWRHKVRGDKRVTRVGKLLRRTSLDELPQLVNVLRGDMSLVGPRPELPDIVASYAGWQHRRHLVRPGMTGWWQIQGRSDLPMHEHTELDMYYVERLSLRLDLAIIWGTVRVVLRGSGAF